MVTWLVCGGRDFGLDGPHGPEFSFIVTKLEELAREQCPGYPSEELQLPEGIKIIAGKAKGVDTVAVDWAVVNWLQFKEFPADWNKFGRAAGYIRNKQMLEEGKPDLVIVFPGGKGTNNMVTLALKVGIPVVDYREAYQGAEQSSSLT